MLLFKLKRLVVLPIYLSMHLASLLYEVRTSDPTLYSGYTGTFAQIELDYSIMACTFSLLGAFLRPFVKQQESFVRNSYQLNSMNSNLYARKRSSIPLPPDEEISTLKLRPDEGQSIATVIRSNSEDRTSVDSILDREISGIMMKKQWSVDLGAGEGSGNAPL